MTATLKNTRFDNNSQNENATQKNRAYPHIDGLIKAVLDELGNGTKDHCVYVHLVRAHAYSLVGVWARA